MSRKFIDLSLNYDEIRTRIEMDMCPYKKIDWAKKVGVSQSLISNVHKNRGKSSDKISPSLEYIVAVARFTGKPVEWYLYGTPVGAGAGEAPPSGRQAGHPLDDCGDWSPEDIRCCKQLKSILDSRHPVIVPAIQANLAAFEISVRSDRDRAGEAAKLKANLMKKTNEIKELKKRILNLEALADPAGPSTGTVVAE